MNAKLIVNGVEITVGIDLLKNIASNLSDNVENREMFHVLAQSDSASIRGEIAYKDSISEETALILLNDKDTTVLEKIIRNDMGKSIITEELLDVILNISNENTLIEIANNFESFENIDTEDTAKKLIDLKNPTLTLAIAENYSTPKKILKILAKDNDPDIANAAKKSLE